MTGSPPSQDGGDGSGKKPLRRGSWRVLAVSMAVSVAIHTAAIFLYPVLMRQARTELSVRRDRSPTTRFRATEVVRLSEVSLAAVEPPPQDTEPEPETEPPVPPPEEAVTFPEEGADAEDDDLSAAERLRPREADPRVWMPPSPERAELTDDERVRIRLYGRLQAWNDSVAAAEGMGPDVDWTYTDDEGRRWGISPGALHLGGLVIPMPSFGAGGAGNYLETRERLWEWEQIERGAALERARATQDERARAIRERKDQERAEKADSTGGGG